MTGSVEDWIAEGERRALREWQAEHQEPCDECEWAEARKLNGDVKIYLRHPCVKHGGQA